MEHTYRNPVMPGFHPDPSIVCTGDDFYLVNSTFHHFPAVQISHSKDLVHWQYVGHAVTNPEWLDLSPYTDHWGVWAPDISWHNGMFHIVFPIVNRVGRIITFENWIVHAKAAQGPWSRPVLLNREGIDPSLFYDDDGSCYLAANEGLKMARLDESMNALVEPLRVVWPGTGRSYPEGPHVFKRNGWYYAMLAEGGTFYDHCETIARSRSLDGPWEECPHNPIMIQNDPGHPIQRTGHGKMIKTAKGDWWFCYLVGRPTKDGRRSVLGRETALDPVVWTEDGWPVVNGGNGPSIVQQVPDLPWTPGEVASSDNFSSPILGPQWLAIRSFVPGGIQIHPETHEVELAPWPVDLDDPDARNVLLQRERHFSFDFSTTMRFAPAASGAYAGITCWFDGRAYIQFGLTRGTDTGTHAIRLFQHSFEGDFAQTVPCTATHLHLSVEVCGNRRIFRAKSADSPSTAVIAECVVEDASFLCDDLEDIHTGFTGTLVGMFNICAPEAAPDTNAHAFFGPVEYREKP